ncbi:MAG: phosphatidate cytidylyltransferase [Defluviitaleaceae bacterium]|nr:phosphatidate cytidylyltransferase [Defluviitaleaceae bacterium]
MKKRVISAIIGLPIFIVLIYFGGIPLAAALGLLAILGYAEFLRAFKRKNIFTVLVGFIYVFILLSCVFFVRHFFGLWYTWFIFIAAWGCDTGAYFCGKAFGKRKLVPKLSPNKTISGAVGGTITAAVLCAVFAAFIIPTFMPVVACGGGITTNPNIILFALYGAIAAILAQAGDLTASAIKRRTGIKDFGGIIPGHGGVLDRFDSILFVAPFALLFLWWVL